jgi:lactoylglutathione lyase
VCSVLFLLQSENVSEVILQLGYGPLSVEVDLMEPLNPDIAPKVHVPSLNHIGLWVHPLEACVKYLDEQVSVKKMINSQF